MAPRLHPNPTGWTDERAELAKKLWTVDGYSASQIAKALNCGISRNGVIGKLHRMGLTGAGAAARRSASAPMSGISPQAKPRQTRPGALKIAGRGTAFTEAAPRPPRVVIPFREEAAGTCNVMTISAHQCRWPIGDPGAAEFTFCGDRTPEGKPYCATHHKRAISPNQPSQKPRAYVARGG